MDMPDTDKNRDAPRSDNRNAADNRADNRNENRADGDGGSERNQGQGVIGGTMEMARNVGEQAWSAATNPVATAQDLARRAAEQTTAATGRAGDYVTRNVNEYPFAALLVAGAVGYGLAYLIHSSWPQGGWGDWSNWSNWTGDRDRDRNDRSERNNGRDDRRNR